MICARFHVNLQQGCQTYPHPNIAFHFNPRFEGGERVIVMNSWFAKVIIICHDHNMFSEPVIFLMVPLYNCECAIWSGARSRGSAGGPIPSCPTVISSWLSGDRRAFTKYSSAEEGLAHLIIGKHYICAPTPTLYNRTMYLLLFYRMIADVVNAVAIDGDVIIDKVLVL